MTYQSVPNQEQRGAFASAEKKHPFIDADSHIEDHDGIFEHLDRAFWHRRPKIVHIGDMIAHRTQRNYAWLIDGEMRPKMQGYQASCHASPITTDYARLKPVSTAIQGILDIDAYCAKMDEIQLDVATIYSTLFLQPLTRDPLFEDALMRAYNSHMAETCGQRPDRLKWAALLPMRLPHLAVKEVHRAKALGASSLMVLGTVGSVLLHDRRFDPVWAAAEEVGLPVCVHVGWAHDGIGEGLDSPAAAFILNFELTIVFGFFSFLGGGILDRFKSLKVGFLEGGASWFPTVMDRMDKWRVTPAAEVWPAEKSPMEYIREREIYFTVEGDEANLADFTNLIGPDRILGAADFPHTHYAGGKLGEAFSSIRERDDVPEDQKDLIFGPNAMRFYGFKPEDVYFGKAGAAAR